MASSVKLGTVSPESHRVELPLPGLADLFEGRVGLIDSRGQQRLSKKDGESFVDHLEAKRRTGHL